MRLHIGEKNILAPNEILQKKFGRSFCQKSKYLSISRETTGASSTENTRDKTGETIREDPRKTTREHPPQSAERTHVLTFF